MIIDRLENAPLCFRLGERMKRAFRELQRTDLARRAPGRYDIVGSEIFALVQRYDTKPRALGKWEAHRRYIDIQYMADGAELMGCAPLAHMKVTEPYNTDKDIAFFAGQGRFAIVPAGVFAIFFPHDVHMPSLAVGAPTPVQKVVIKVQAA
jgi:YhcH/YjgK/YiaL family protein